ncbi:MAG TPA: Hpt domain-containing protein, partial [Nitrolancea sp.]|nr:Hpt domain-containing protein [Nitrolancea sp.]
MADVDELVAFDREELLHRCMGSLELAERLLNRFEQRFPLEMGEIETSWKAGDASTLARITHRLKGAAANIAAPSLRVALQTVEDGARAQRLETI